MYWLGAARRPGLKLCLRPGHGARRAGGRLLRPEAADRAFGPAEGRLRLPKSRPPLCAPQRPGPFCIIKGGCALEERRL